MDKTRVNEFGFSGEMEEAKTGAKSDEIVRKDTNLSKSIKEKKIN